MDYKSAFRRSLLLRTPVVKGFIFGVAWYFFPAWLFLPVAAYLYFLPYFQSSKFFAVFVAIMGLYVFTSAPLSYAVVGGILFGWLIAIRELLFIDRRSSYEALIIAVSFFHLRIFYDAHAIIGITSFFAALLLAAIIAWMVKEFIDCFITDKMKERRQSLLAVGIGLLGFFLWQIIVIGFVIPVDFVYQSALTFLLTVGMIDILSAYMLGDAPREKTLLTATMVFCGLVLILTAAPLGL